MTPTEIQDPAPREAADEPTTRVKPPWGKAIGLLLLLATAALFGTSVLDSHLRPWLSVGAARAEERPKNKAPRPATSTAPAAQLVAPSGSGSAEVKPPAALTPDGKVILNLAEKEHLTKLPGVGPKKAQAMLDLRAKLGGRFKRVEDLLRIRGIKRRTLDRLRPLIVLDPAPAPPASQPEYAASQ